MQFSDFHKYNKLVRRNIAPPLTCHCGMEYALMLGEADEPVLKCFNCNTLTTPGLKILDQMKKYVN